MIRALCILHEDDTLIQQHFQKYRERKPWDFCWRIAIEGTVVSLVASICLSVFDVAERDIKLRFPDLLLLGVVIAPVLETLIFQALPIWIARRCHASFSVQVTASLIPFFLAHVIEGIGTGIAAGLVGGFYFAFTYAHWREQGRWTAFWTTAVSHSIHNGILIPLAFGLGEI
jgi:hypothetical protein